MRRPFILPLLFALAAGPAAAQEPRPGEPRAPEATAPVDPVLAVAAVFSVMRNVSVPYGISTPDEPNISSTRWRTVIDHTAKRYFFESALSPNTFWVELNNLDFSEGAPTKRLSLGEGEKTVYAGDASAQFTDAEPFTFLGLG